jgi:hypothetical protein
MTQPSLPAVARRTAFSLHAPNLSVVVFERPLSREERQAFESAVMDFYSQKSGGPHRAMIDVSCFAADTYGFCKVSGRELPTMALFDQLLAWLNEQLGLTDVTTFVTIEDVKLPSITPNFIHPKYGIPRRYART